MHFQEPTFMLASFYTPDPVASYAELSIVDNDTLKLVPQVFFQTRGRNYLPNKVCFVQFSHVECCVNFPC